MVASLARQLGSLAVISVAFPEGRPPRTLLARAGGPVRDLSRRAEVSGTVAWPRMERFERGRLSDLLEGLPPAVRAPLRWVGRGALAVVPVRHRGAPRGLVLALRLDRPFAESERALLRNAARQVTRLLELHDALERTREALQARDQFLGLASHELAGPLATASLLATAVEMALDRSGPLDAQTRATLHMTRHQLERASAMVRRLAEAARRAHHALEIQPAPMDLAELVEAAVSELRLRDPRGQTLELRLARRHLYGQWDRAQLEQVVHNLLSNALKFGAGRPVRVTLDRARGGAELRVKDQGIGIRRSDQSRIFRRFTRAVPPRQFPGLGLGLWLVKEIVASHHGQISLTSEPGHGAEFVIWLPGAAQNDVKLV
jgi:signal transduction histidine kinase